MLGTTFNTAARAGAANLLLPVKSQLVAGSRVFHLLFISLVICPIVLALSSHYPKSARASFRSKKQNCSPPLQSVCPVVHRDKASLTTEQRLRPASFRRDASSQPQLFSPQV